MDAVESSVVPGNDRRIDASAHEFCDNHRMMNKLLEAYLLLRIILLIFFASLSANALFYEYIAQYCRATIH